MAALKIDGAILTDILAGNCVHCSERLHNPLQTDDIPSNILIPQLCCACLEAIQYIGDTKHTGKCMDWDTALLDLLTEYGTFREIMDTREELFDLHDEFAFDFEEIL